MKIRLTAWIVLFLAMFVLGMTMPQATVSSALITAIFMVGMAYSCVWVSTRVVASMYGSPEDANVTSDADARHPWDAHSDHVVHLVTSVQEMSMDPRCERKYPGLFDTDVPESAAFLDSYESMLRVWSKHNRAAHARLEEEIIITRKAMDRAMDAATRRAGHSV